MISREEIKWEVLSRASKELEVVRQRIGSEGYDAERLALKEYLCNYFNSGTCRHKQGNQISPMSSTLTGKGGRCLKVRWGLPGMGKSGGLRLAVVAYCDLRHVKICGAWRRSADPTDSDFDTAVSDA